MRLLLTLSLALSSAAALAQVPITITPAQFTATASSVDRYQPISVSGLANPATGANQHWDYRNVTAQGPVEAGGYTSVGANPPFAGSVRSYVYYQGGLEIETTAYEGFDADGFGQLGTVTAAQSFPIDFITGTAGDVINVPGQSAATRILRVPLPLTNTTRTVRTSRYALQSVFTIQDFGIIQAPFRQVTRVTSVDSVAGWGTLRIPVAGSAAGSAPIPVLLDRRRYMVQDSFYLNGQPAPAALLDGLGLTQGAITTDFRYRFFRQNSGQPVMTLIYDDSRFLTPSEAAYSTEPNIPPGTQVALSQAKTLANGDLHTVSVRADGTLWAWGNNTYGQLGLGSTTDRYSPVQVGTATNWVSAAASGAHTIAVRSDGTLWAWGLNNYGQLGLGTSAFSQNSPVQVGTATNWVSAAAGTYYTVAVRADGTLWAWGQNNVGQLGDGTTTQRNSPVQVGAATSWTSAAAGTYHTIAVRSDGTLWAWGQNSYGQLGNSSTNPTVPVQVGTATNWVSAAAGDLHTVATRADGTLWAWGNNDYGQLGLGTSASSQNSPVQVGTATNWVSAAAGYYHTVATRADGTLWAWGQNSVGQLGLGTTTDQGSPVRVGTATSWTSAAACYYHTGGEQSCRAVWGWGDNQFGQVGDGTTIQRSSPVLAFSGVSLTSFTPASAAPGTTVVVTGTGLLGLTVLTVNGVSALASVSNSTNTGFSFVVPAGATSTGTVIVAAGCGTSNGLAFTVIQDLVISTPGQTIAAGTYRNITIANGGVGSLPVGGTVSVTGALVVQSGGRFNVGTGASPVGGPGTFTLDAGGYLYMVLPLYATGAQGAIQVTGTRSFASDATYEFGGAVTAIGGGLPATVTNLFLSPTGTVQLLLGVAIRRELRLTSGTLQLNGQNLTLLSDANTTAQVNQDGVTTTGTVVNGAVTAQRYIAANGNAGLGYRHLSSPVNGNRLDDLAVPGGFQPVFNAAYNTSANSNTVSPFPTVFGFDPARIGTVPSSYIGFDQGYYSPVTSTQPDLFVPGRGYSTQLAAGQTVDFVGVLNQTAVALPLPRAAGTANPDDGKGWNLLGNPFASAFALASLDNTPGLDNAKYLFQSTGPYAGSYQTVLGGFGQPLLAPGQGFFARVSTPGTTPTITFALAGRRVDFSPSSTFHRPTTETRPLLELELASSSGTLRDRTTLYADAQATAGLDAAFDAVKLSNPHGLNLSQPLPGTPLALAFNALPVFTAGTVVPLRVGVPAAGSYTLRVNQLLNLPAGTTALLVDNELNTRTYLATLPASGYAFSVSAAQAATALTGRFWLNLVPAGTALASTNGQANALVQLFPNPAHATATLTGAAPSTRVQVFDALGRTVLATTADASGTAVLRLPAGLASGVYVVRAGATVRRLTVE